VAFGYDVIEPSNDVVTKLLKKALRVFKAVFFTSVVVPTAVVSGRILLLTTQSRVLVEKLMMTQLLTDFHAFLKC
jgi:hypothetical protein